MKIADYACRAILRLYPRDIREAHAAEMRETFLETCAVRSSIPELGNLAVSALKARAGYPRILSGQEPGRSRRGGSMMWRDDVRHALRRLRAQPVTAIGSALMLGLAIGLTTAMFTLVDALIIRPVPFPEAERLTRLSIRSRNQGVSVVSLPVLHAWRTAGIFEGVEGYSPETFILGSGDGMTERPGAFVSPGLLPLLGVRPAAGRLFESGEGRAGTGDRVLISEALWRSMFASDPAITGRRVPVDGALVTVVGVMPASFRFPRWDTALWRPLDFDAPPPAEAKRLPYPVVRVARGIPMDDAMKAATDTLHRVEPAPANKWVQPDSLATRYGSQYARLAAPVLGGCALIVFVVLCANVSGLLLARLERRRREIGVAVALGASRARLVREALLESAALAGAGWTLGLLLATGLVAVAMRYLPASLLASTLNPLNLDTRALALASVAAVVSALAAGLPPALLAPRVTPMTVLRHATRGGTEGPGARTLRRALLVGEVALAFTLLVGAALLVRSFMGLAAADRGLDTSNVIVGFVGNIGGPKATRAERAALAAAIEASLGQVPGARHVALSRGAPPDGFGFSTTQWLSDIPGAAPVDATVQVYEVGQAFFDIYGVPITQGRTFAPGDPENTVIVGQRLAEMLWPGQSPVGRSFQIFNRSRHVVGVARELHVPTTEHRYDLPEFYRPFVPGSGTLTLNIRCHGPCPDPALVRQRVRDIQADAIVWDLGPLDASYQQHVESPRAAAMLVLVFAAVAALAVAGGLFAVSSYLAGRRRREFGVRLALGARPRELRALVLREGVTMVLLGAAVGAISTWWLTRSLSSLMYRVTLGDPRSWVSVFGVLAVIAIAASWWPAARASRIDPSTLLREE